MSVRSAVASLRISAARRAVSLATPDVVVRTARESRSPEFEMSHLVEPLEILCSELDASGHLSANGRHRARQQLVGWLGGAALLEDTVPTPELARRSNPRGNGCRLIFVTGSSPSGIAAATSALEATGYVEPLALPHTPSAAADWESRSNEALMAAGFASTGPESLWHVPAYAEYVSSTDLGAAYRRLSSLVVEVGGAHTAVASTSWGHLEHTAEICGLVDAVIVRVAGGDPEAVERSAIERCEYVRRQRENAGSEVDPDRLSRYVRWRCVAMDEVYEEQRAGNPDALFFDVVSDPSDLAAPELPRALLDLLSSGSGRRNPS